LGFFNVWGMNSIFLLNSDVLRINSS
jgi:hypothetical protein